MKHYSVMLNEALEALNIKSDGIYVDGTLGRAGHASQIKKQLATGKLIAFDKDLDALAASRTILGEDVFLIHDSFSNHRTHLESMGIQSVDGFLFDLGVSSPQFDDASRGFSYRFDARLDMRMDQTQTLSAYEVVNTYEAQALETILKKYSDERYAKGIVRNIIEQRPIETTFELVACIKKAYPAKELKKGHPAKKTFQAIRMEVNQELQDIEKALEDAIELLSIGGRVVVITFHSIEDRLVKHIFSKYANMPKVNPRIPITEPITLKHRWIQKALKPNEEELEENNRSHSAILRAIERIE